MKEIDPKAKFEVERKFGLPGSLHIPIAARDKGSIERYIGKIVCELSKKNTGNAFLVSIRKPDQFNQRLRIWKLEGSVNLFKELQVWVNVDYKNYRYAYRKAFPSEELSCMVLDHILNRRIARLKGLKYLRLVSITREVNTSSAFSENWGVSHHKSERMRNVNAKNVQNIQYADLCDIVKILNIKPGGGIMETVNTAQSWLDEI